MKKSIFLMIALAMLTTMALTSCSNDKAVSTSPTLGTLSIDANTHYTGQYATINVAYSDLGEHVYYSSTAKFTYTITGPYGYSYNDSISVADAGGVVPTPFSFRITLPEAPGTYSLTLTTPYINKSAGSGEEGDPIIFNRLSSNVSFVVKQADAINANFGDSRETLSAAINVTACAISGQSLTTETFDADGLANTATTDESGFTTQRFYKFISNSLQEVEELTSNAAATQKLDESGNPVIEDISNDKLVTTIMDKAVLVFRLSSNNWELHKGNIYDTEDETLAAKYGNNIISAGNVEKQTEFLNDLLSQKLKSYSCIYKMYADDDESIKSYCVISIYAKGTTICLSRRYVKELSLLYDYVPFDFSIPSDGTTTR